MQNKSDAFKLEPAYFGVYPRSIFLSKKRATTILWIPQLQSARGEQATYLRNIFFMRADQVH